MNLKLEALLQNVQITIIATFYLSLILMHPQWRSVWCSIKQFFNSLKQRLKSTICRFFTGK